MMTNFIHCFNRHEMRLEARSLQEAKSRGGRNLEKGEDAEVIEETKK